jgi:hypothetical protein
LRLQTSALRLSSAALFTLFFSFFTAPLFAWSPNAHMAVAYRAYQRLTPRARARVDALLPLNPAFAGWDALLPPGWRQADRSALLFAIAATWADQIKDDRTYTDDGAENGNRPFGPSSSQNVGYRDTLRHKYWHFVDRPFSLDGTPLPMVPEPNAQSRINRFRSILASDASDDLKSYDLIWLLHLIGDVHQPLHCATRVSADRPGGDAGGNSVPVCDASCAATQTLHAYWDTVLGGGFSVAAAVALAKSLPAAHLKRARNLDEGVWVLESFRLARTRAYRWSNESGPGPVRLSAAYRHAASVLARQQISLAAARLAAVLNEELN